MPSSSTYYIGWYNVHIPSPQEGKNVNAITRVWLWKTCDNSRGIARSNVILLYLDNKHYYVYLDDHQRIINRLLGFKMFLYKKWDIREIIFIFFFIGPKATMLQALFNLTELIHESDESIWYLSHLQLWFNWRFNICRDLIQSWDTDRR